MVCGFLTRIIVTYANMVSCDRSSISDNTPSAQSQCSPTTHILMQVRSFGKILQSQVSSVLYHSTSELLHSFNHGCFTGQDLAVWAIEHPYAQYLLGTLADSLGCSPLPLHEPYRPRPVSQ